jgi:hypothetical protein
MGKKRHADFSGVKVDDLHDVVAEMLREYGDEVYLATEDGLDAATKIAFDALKNATPVDSREFKKGWKKSKKYKLKRFIGNKRVVYGKDGEEISLANIFEYSTIRGNPFIRETFSKNINRMATAIVAEIKKEA